MERCLENKYVKLFLDSYAPMTLVFTFVYYMLFKWMTVPTGSIGDGIMPIINLGMAFIYGITWPVSIPYVVFQILTNYNGKS